MGLQVQWLVVPSVKSLVGMWTRKFGFLDLSMLECEALEDRIVTPDTSSATMLKKKIYRHVLCSLHVATWLLCLSSLCDLQLSTACLLM